MKIAVMCAMGEEINLLTGHMDNIESAAVAGMNVTYGELFGHSLMLCVGMIGKTNMAAGTQTAICSFSPDLLVNVGLAGNCTGKLPLGGAVVANKLVFHDFDMKIAAENSPFTEFYTPTLSYINLAAGILDGLRAEYILGTVATGDSFICDEAVKQDIIERTGAACVEMEGAAFACVAEKNGVDYLSVKIMSDNASDGDHNGFLATMDAGAYCEMSTAVILGLCGRIEA